MFMAKAKTKNYWLAIVKSTERECWSKNPRGSEIEPETDICPTIESPLLDDQLPIA